MILIKNAMFAKMLLLLNKTRTNQKIRIKQSERRVKIGEGGRRVKENPGARKEPIWH